MCHGVQVPDLTLETLKTVFSFQGVCLGMLGIQLAVLMKGSISGAGYNAEVKKLQLYLAITGAVLKQQFSKYSIIYVSIKDCQFTPLQRNTSMC